MAAGQDDLLTSWEALGTSEKDEVRSSLEAIAIGLTDRWPPIPSGAFPRLQNTLRVELCDRQVVLTGRVDLALGRVRSGSSNTVLLDVKSGSPRIDDRDDSGWYALLETLRSGCGPAQTGNYYLSTGLLDLHPVTFDDLERATRRVADALRRMAAIASGREPARTPGPLCPWCPAYGSCDDGQRHIRESDESTDAWLDFDDDWSEGQSAE